MRQTLITQIDTSSQPQQPELMCARENPSEARHLRARQKHNGRAFSVRAHAPSMLSMLAAGWPLMYSLCRACVAQIPVTRCTLAATVRELGPTRRGAHICAGTARRKHPFSIRLRTGSGACLTVCVCVCSRVDVIDKSLD